MWLQLSQILKKFTERNARKFTVSFAFCAHVDVIKIEKKRRFLRARADYLSLYPMRVCNRKTMGSHHKGMYRLAASRPLLKAGGPPEIKWSFRKFKEGLKGKRKLLEHHQTVERPPKGHPRLVDNCLVYVYQFLTSNSNFKTTSNLQNFPFS